MHYASTTWQSRVRHFNALAGGDSLRISTLKRKLSKSAFSEGVRHFERQFQVDGDVARNRSMDRWIGE